MGELLERGGELASIAALLDACAAGEAGALIVEGPAGIGKTALLDAARAGGRDAGVRVLSARGGELEREFAYAVVRQLLEAEARKRPELLAGAAGLAGPVLASDPAPAGDQGFAIVHGLYWLTANLAGGGPLALVVDDAHWCDRPSLGFLLYLLRRLDGLPVALVLAARPREPGGPGELLEQLAAEPLTRVLAPAALSVGAVGELVHASLGDADERFVLACHDASGGNPFLATELLAALARDGRAPSADAAAGVSELGPTTVRRAIVLRLGRLSHDAGALAQATAVLGGRATLHQAAALAGLDEPAAAAALDALAAIEILEPRLPPEFVHPIVRAAVYDDLTPAARSLAHARAARLLAAGGADREQVAAHLLASEPAGDAWAAEQLRGAAATALARGAPEAARTYLERGLAEAPDSAPLLRELGRAEALTRDPRALGHFEQALAAAEDAAARASIAEELAALLVYAGQWDAGVALVDATLHELGDHDQPAAIRLETLRAGTSAYDPRGVAAFDASRSRLEALAARGGKAARALSLLLSAMAMWRADGIDRVVALAERGLDGGRLLADEGAEAWTLGQAVSALVAVDELDRAERLTADMLADAGRRGSVLGASAASSFAGYVQARRGALRDAEASLRVGFQLAVEHGLMFGLPSIFSYAVDVLPERPGFADVARSVEELTLPPGFDATTSGAMVLDVRGRLRLLRDQREAGIADLRRSGEIFDAVRLRNPAISSWRSALALALRVSDPDEARRLVAEELALARATGLARPLGVAQRAAGLLAGGEEGIALLREAAATLEGAPLERGRALADLGAALRRAGRRAEAREPLREALELARRCGAERLAAQAEGELRAAGAKPRRLAFSGVESLTASELRIAELAASGLSNQQVAEALFVTAKTVENHLGRVYQKLGIHSRERLAAALRAQT